MSFLYLPIVVLVVMSFNAAETPFRWAGFAPRGTASCHDELIRTGLVNTLIVAVGADALPALGTLLALGLTAQPFDAARRVRARAGGPA